MSYLFSYNFDQDFPNTEILPYLVPLHLKIAIQFSSFSTFSYRMMNKSLQCQCKLFSSYPHLKPKVISSILPIHEIATSPLACAKNNPQMFKEGIPIPTYCMSFSVFFLFSQYFGCEHIAIVVLGFVFTAFSRSSLI